MATQPTTPGQIPTGFKSPFKRVPMAERTDDAFACIATLTGKPLAEIMKLAYEFGYPKHGPGYCSIGLIQQLLSEFSLIGSDYDTVNTISALPDVALLLADYDPETELGRHIVWHHVRACVEFQAFHYAIDVGFWVPPEFQVTRDFSFVQLNTPLWFIGVTQKPTPAAKGK
jgi:hypothetical protein